jgi:L-alanine-DL-glutamate epimerase-like enolase superfamily enzyme
LTIVALSSRVLPPTSTAIDSPRFAIASVHNAAVSMVDDSGISGFGYAYTFDANSSEAVRHLIDTFSGRYQGREAADLRRVRTELLTSSANFLGVRGLARLAVAALDMAAWDLLCRLHQTNLPGMVGAERFDVPVYSAYGLWSGLEPETCATTARDVADDFDTPHAKMWVGSRDFGLEYERVAAVREALGPQASIIVDAAQAYDWRTACRLAERLAGLDVLWFEDPVEYDDLAGLQAFAAASPIPMGTGEHVYGLDNLKQLLDLGNTAYVVLDLERIGGITDFLSASAMCEAYRVSVGTHVFTHVSAQLLATSRQGAWCEYSPLWDGYFGKPTIADGLIRVDRYSEGIGIVLADDFGSGL